MSGQKLNDYAIGDENIDAVMLSLDQTYRTVGGLSLATLTNWENSSAPELAAGSVIEVNGALFEFTSNESISTTDPVTTATIVQGNAYICAVPSGSSCTLACTQTDPTWSDSKQGWYGTGGQANNRYLYSFNYVSIPQDWKNKRKLYYQQQLSSTIFLSEKTSVSIPNGTGTTSVNPTGWSQAGVTSDNLGIFSAGTFTIPADGVYTFVLFQVVTTGTGSATAYFQYTEGSDNWAITNRTTFLESGTQVTCYVDYSSTVSLQLGLKAQVIQH
jgi:hypothetical protein